MQSLARCVALPTGRGRRGLPHGPEEGGGCGSGWATALQSMAFGVLLAKWNAVAWVCSAKKQPGQASVSFCSRAWQRCLLRRREVNAKRCLREGRGWRDGSGTVCGGPAAPGQGPAPPWAGGGGDLLSLWDCGLPDLPPPPCGPLPAPPPGPLWRLNCVPPKDTSKS